MERIIAIAVTLIFALSVIGLTENAIATAKAKTKGITGEIVSIDATKNLLNVKTKKGEMTFAIDEKTKIKMGKEEKNISDLKVGEKIRVYYSHIDGKDLAETIIVKASSKK